MKKLQKSASIVLLLALAAPAVAETSLLDTTNKSAVFEELQSKIKAAQDRREAEQRYTGEHPAGPPSPFENYTFPDPKDSPENNWGIRIDRTPLEPAQRVPAAPSAPAD